MGQTDIYLLGYLEPGQADYALDLDERRFRTMEAQLKAVFSLFGNGILSSDDGSPSWWIEADPDNTNAIIITPGQGHVSWKKAITRSSVNIDLPPTTTGQAMYYIYAVANSDTPALQTIDFKVSMVQVNKPDDWIGLGAVFVDTTQSPITLTPYNDAEHGRVEISIFSGLASLINKHKHVGGSANPSQIDLASHVQGKLSGDHIINLNLDSVTSGTLDADRLPLIDHNSLLNIGALTHPQLESILAGLVADSEYRFSDIVTANMLQLALSLKRHGVVLDVNNEWAFVDQNMSNAIVYIPGIPAYDTLNAATIAATDDRLIASHSSHPGFYNTDDTVPDDIPLATVDKELHHIRGTNAAPINSDDIIWNTDTDFETALAQAIDRSISPDPATHDIVVSGEGLDGGITLEKPVNYLGVASNNLSTWQFGTFLSDTASVETYGSPPPPNTFIDGYGLRRYLYKIFDSSQDWSIRQKIGIGYGVDADSYPGAIYCYLIVAAGTGGSTTVVVNEPDGGASTISISTIAIPIANEGDSIPANGYIEIDIDSFSLDDVTEVLGIGFYWQTITGWDSQEVEFYLLSPTSTQIAYDPVSIERSTLPDTSAIFVWNETLYAINGVLMFRFDSNNNSTVFNTVNWDATLPAQTQIKVQTRVSNSEGSLGGGGTTAYLVDTDNNNSVDSRGNKGRYIDIIVTLYSSTSHISAPVLGLLTVSFTSPGASNTRIWETYEDWYTGRTIQNLDIDQISGVMTISDTARVGQFTYNRGNGSFASMDIYGSDEESYPSNGILDAYLTPVQVWNKTTSYGLRRPLDAITLSDNSIVFADTDNDRLMQVDGDGFFVRAIQGNIRLNQDARDLVALQASLNIRLNILWIAFSQNVTFDKTKIFLKFGQTSIAFSDSRVSLALFEPMDGLSATIQATFSSELMVLIKAWNGTFSVLMNQGAVTAQAAGGGTGGSGGGGGSGGDTGGGGGVDAASVTMFSGEDTDCLPEDIYVNLGTGSLAGKADCVDGLPSDATSSENTTDFDDNDTVDTYLQGPGGQKNIVTLDVFVGEIVYDNLIAPLSIQVVEESNKWVTASPGEDSAICYSSASARLWTIPSSVLPMDIEKRGSAYLLDSGNVLLAAPIGADDKGTVMEVNRSGNLPITVLKFNGDAVRAVPYSVTEYYVAVDDSVNGGSNSRIVRVNTSGGVTWIWGTGILSHPTGLKQLSNGDILVSV